MNGGKLYNRKKLIKKAAAAGMALCMSAGLLACGKELQLDLEGNRRQEEEGGGMDGKEEELNREQDFVEEADDADYSWDAKTANVTDMMEGITARTVGTEENQTGQNTAVIADFAVRLLQGCAAEDQTDGRNTLLSPVSVLYALAMTANGAEGNTLRQMEAVFGLSVDELNEYLHVYYKSLPSAEKCRVSLANSIWFAQERDFAADSDFLQRNADYYGADIFRTVFDENARQAVNAWVKAKTNGMIPEILDEMPKDAVMYLINAVSFDAEWQTIYKESQIRTGEFTAASGEKEQAEFMCSEESAYLEAENAVGFLKYYADEKYAFAALLPAEGMSVEEYTAALTGEKLQNILNNAEHTAVDAEIPKFSCASDYTMNDMLLQMGMSDAFDRELADFSGMGDVPEGENIYISRVLHKARIEVDERGTRAGAATVVEMNRYATAIRETKVVRLDRPFIYMIIDCETNLPLFIGTVKTVSR